MKIRNVHDLEKLESRIKTQMRRYDIDDILLGLRNIPSSTQSKLQPFMVADTALFAVRFALSPARTKSNKRLLDWNKLGPLINLVNNYLLGRTCFIQSPG